jgi:uncharacterized protein YukE
VGDKMKITRARKIKCLSILKKAGFKVKSQQGSPQDSISFLQENVKSMNNIKSLLSTLKNNNDIAKASDQITNFITNLKSSVPNSKVLNSVPNDAKKSIPDAFQRLNSSLTSLDNFIQGGSYKHSNFPQKLIYNAINTVEFVISECNRGIQSLQQQPPAQQPKSKTPKWMTDPNAPLKSSPVVSPTEPQKKPYDYATAPYDEF